jgi:nucleoside-diphosphate kinase
MERTLILIKPDGVERKLIGKIVSAYEERNLSIVGLKMIRANRAIAEKHYEEHIGRPYFETLINYITEERLCAVVVEGDNAIELVRRINGDKDPMLSDNGSIRGMYSNHKTRNLVHASDSTANAEREIAIWFKDEL